MKQEEREFLVAVATGKPVREVIEASNTHYKRCWRWLEKWTRKGWYEYGVSLDIGWLTAEGKRQAS